MYLGHGGCLLNVPVRYLTSRGCSESLAKPLIVTTLAKAFCAAHKPAYKQPSLHMPCKNLCTLSILVI